MNCYAGDYKTKSLLDGVWTWNMCWTEATLKEFLVQTGLWIFWKIDNEFKNVFISVCCLSVIIQEPLNRFSWNAKNKLIKIL